METLKQCVMSVYTHHGPWRWAAICPNSLNKSFFESQN